MTAVSKSRWGPWGVVSIVPGLASWFFGGFLSLIIGLGAVGTGFFGSRMHQKLDNQ